MMKTLANALVGDFSLPHSAPLDDLRQLGYAAQVARGSVDDPEDRLTCLVKFCRAAVSNAPVADVVHAHDANQARWGAAWHVDVSKFRTELPLHVKLVNAKSC